MFPRVLASLAADIQDLDELAFVRRYPDAWLIWENRPGDRSSLPLTTQTLGDGANTPRMEFEPAAYRLLGSIRSLTIGRLGEGILIKHPTVSETHLVLQQTATGWAASDAGSRNGTTVDGQRLQPSTPIELASGARIQLGAVELTFLPAKGLFRRLTAV